MIAPKQSGNPIEQFTFNDVQQDVKEKGFTTALEPHFASEVSLKLGVAGGPTEVSVGGSSSMYFGHRGEWVLFGSP